VAAEDLEREGWQYLAEGRLEEAEGMFRRALELNPDRAEALMGLGQVYVAWDDVDDAIELFQMALSLIEPRLPRGRRRVSPSDPVVRPYCDGLAWLAFARMRRDQWQEAIAPLEEILAWDPGGRDGEIWLWLGLCHHRLGQWSDALRCYDRARPKQPAGWYLYGLVAIKTGATAEAVKSFRVGADVWPEAAPLLAYYPRVRGLDRHPTPPAPDDRHADAVHFVEATIDLWTADDQKVLRDALYPDAVGSL
jgi:tetratricopeptide (TPR) repeat protein